MHLTFYCDLCISFIQFQVVLFGLEFLLNCSWTGPFTFQRGLFAIINNVVLYVGPIVCSGKSEAGGSCLKLTPHRNKIHYLYCYIIRKLESSAKVLVYRISKDAYLQAFGQRHRFWNGKRIDNIIYILLPETRTAPLQERI